MAKTRVKASPGRPRTSVPGDTADTMKWVKISFGGKTSRYVVHYHLDNGGDGPLKPICGSKNVHNRSYEKVIGEHVNCTKCITKKGAIRLAAANAAMVEARVAQQARDIEKAAEQVANTKPRSVPPVSTPVMPDMPPLILRPAPVPAAVPAQRNGVDTSLFRAPEFPQPQSTPVDDDYDDDYDDDADEFDDETDSAEEAPQMTAPTAPVVTPLTAFPKLPTPAPKPAEPVAAEPVASPEPVAAPVAQAEPPVDDDVIVVHSDTYEVTLIHPVTREKLPPLIIQANSEDEAEMIALDYLEVEIVKRSTRIRAARRTQP